MLMGETPTVNGNEGSAPPEGDARRGVELVEGGALAQVKGPDGNIRTVHYTQDAETGQETAWNHFITKGGGKKATDMDGIQRHTRPILLNDGDPNNF